MHAISAQPLPDTTRRRLPPEVRVAQILDAAYDVFSTRGFPHTRIDDIAARAGLSKGGIYAHFDSKDEIFEALLNRTLKPIGIDEPTLYREPVTVERIVDLLGNRLYSWAVSAPAVATLRLLIAESARVPNAVEQWRCYMDRTIVAAVRTLIVKGVREGTLRDGIAARSPSLLIAPIAQACLAEVLRTAERTAGELDHARADYARLLHELLALRHAA
ncbi:TetR/AcrR family transcriptional regulator [Trinickia sp. Y13]|uniref:TetR/AcrR family transcriptional regulator n=1 Tax=Trinickia sp. Y13 TaxID=2917807 RepID=UPI002405070B|nr:TetR/AcrR family transcriptional regulator [Trinickia sp. Y13]MDG0024210.1 TetR/AcrR family transcriptional regulator [Trinickia sp. Y13]